MVASCAPPTVDLACNPGTDEFLEKSNLPKWSEGPERAMVIKEIGLWSLNLPTKTTSTLTLAQESLPTGSTTMPGSERSSLRQTLLQTEWGALIKPLYGACGGLVLRPVRKAHGNSLARLMHIHKCRCKILQKTSANPILQCCKCHVLEPNWEASWKQQVGLILKSKKSLQFTTLTE